MASKKTDKRGWYNWIEACEALQWFGKALVPFIDDVMKERHQTLLSHLKKRNLKPCDKCTLTTLAFQHKAKYGNKCPKNRKTCLCLEKQSGRTQCPTDFCPAMYDSIVLDHNIDQPDWSNTDMSLWSSDHWSFAKCYIHTKGYKMKVTANVTDCTGLLSIVLNNKYIRYTVFANNADCIKMFEHVRDLRNTLMHSPEFAVDDKQRDSLIDCMLDILKIVTNLNQTSGINTCVVKLRQIKDCKIQITTLGEMIAIEATLDEFNAMKQNLSHNQSQQSKALSDMQRICEENQITSLQSSIDSLTQNPPCDHTDIIRALHTKLDELKASIDMSISIKLQDILLELRISNTEMQTINTYRQSSSRLEARLQYLKRKADLQKRFVEHYEHCDSVPVSPFIRSITGNIEDIYVDLLMCKDLTGQPNESPGASMVRSLLDILQTDQKKRCKLVYVLGNAGMGKTTWCKKIIRTWLQVVLKQADEHGMEERESGQEDPDYDALQNFDLLFHVLLRRHPNTTSVLDMIKNEPIVKQYNLSEIVEEVLMNESNRCLILMDGMDEWSPSTQGECPERDGLYDSTVVITTRPYVMIGHRESDESDKTDKIIKIKGIRNPELLVKNVTNTLNKWKVTPIRQGTHERTYKDFMAKVGHLPDYDITQTEDKMPTFLEVPFLLITAVCLWYEDPDFQSTGTKLTSGMISFLFRHIELRGNSRRQKAQTIYPGQEFTAKLTALKKNWSTYACLLPDSLKHDRTFCEYAGLVLKLAKLAFTSLLNDMGKSKLIFTENELLEYMSEDEMDVLCKNGLLSQEDIFDSVTTPTVEISFLHKIFHEYLAGLHLVYELTHDKHDAFRVFKSYYMNASPAFDNDNIAVYVGGIDATALGLLTNRLTDNMIAEKYVNNITYYNDMRLRQVQVAYENHTCEKGQYLVYTENLYVPPKLHKGKFKYLTFLIDSNRKHLKEVLIDAYQISHVAPQLEEIESPLSLTIYDLHCYIREPLNFNFSILSELTLDGYSCTLPKEWTYCLMLNAIDTANTREVHPFLLPFDISVASEKKCGLILRNMSMKLIVVRVLASPNCNLLAENDINVISRTCIENINMDNCWFTRLILLVTDNIHRPFDLTEFQKEELTLGDIAECRNDRVQFRWCFKSFVLICLNTETRKKFLCM